MEIISREEARYRGLKRFFTGTACKHGHIAYRFTINGSCCECGRISSANDRMMIRKITASSSAKASCGAVIDRRSAAERGLTRYFTGRPCKNGHIAERMVSTMSCVECKNAHGRARYARNPEAAIEKVKSWQNANREHHNARAVRYISERRKTDPLFAFKCHIKSMIATSIKRRGFTKRSRTFEILGCTFDEFKVQIERQFMPGMTWDNRGEWQIDHIIPLATAKTEEDVIALNHVSNLRPLWAGDNMQKRDKLLFLI